MSIDVEAVYAELETLQVHLEHTPELGPEYLKERLVETRLKSNRAADLLVEVNRAYSASRHACVALGTLIRMVAATGHDKAEFEQEQVRREDLKFLSAAVQVRRQNLLRTASDIRLLSDLLKVGTGWQPHTPELPHPKPVTEVLDAIDGLLEQQQDAGDFVRAFSGERHSRPAVSDDDVDVSDLLR